MEIEYEVYKDLSLLNKLETLPNIIACDFETASKYTKYEKDKFATALKNNVYTSIYDVKRLNQIITSSGLSHPSLSEVTHISIAWSDKDALVGVLCLDNKLRQEVFNWLVTTERKQIWHNLQFDGRHIIYNTGKLPKDYEDTMLMVKCRKNNADTSKVIVGLKPLMGYKYGEWALDKSDETFTLENALSEKMLKYSAIDACATYSLYQSLKGG